MMLALSVGLLCFVSICNSEIPSRPSISETFVTWFEAFSDDMMIQETGFIARDMSTKKQIANVTIAVNESIVSFETFLGRYDINASYYMSRELNTDLQCISSIIQTPMPRIWDWLEQTEYAGHSPFVNMDIWFEEVNNFEMSIGVSPFNPNIPLVVSTISGNYTSVMSYIGFDAMTPPDSIFEIPPNCPKPTYTTKSRFVGEKPHTFFKPRFFNKQKINKMSSSKYPRYKKFFH